MQALDNFVALSLVNEEAEAVGACAVADHADVNVEDCREYFGTRAGRVAHVVADDGNQAESVFDGYVADFAQISKKSIAEAGLAVR